MKINGDAIYGSRAWGTFKDGEHSVPKGMIGAAQANAKVTTGDFRYTVGKDGSIYAICMTVPTRGETLILPSLASNSKFMNSAIKTVSLLGSSGEIRWTQDDQGLHITCPAEMPLKIAATFKITCARSALTAEASAGLPRDRAK